MSNKGWKLESSNFNNPYCSDTYVNGTYAGAKVSYITLYFFNDQFWQGYVQIKTENHEIPDTIIDKLRAKYGLTTYQLNTSSNNKMHFKCVDSLTNNWIDVQVLINTDKTTWFWYDINFYSSELSKIQETYEMIQSINNINIYEDDL